MSDGLAPGAEFAGHRIEAEIGRGGMGVVYRARHLALDRIRVLKVISPALSDDPAYAARFRREARLAASIEHPNVVTVHHAGEEDGLLYLALAYVDGVDLDDLLRHEGRLEPARAVAIVSQVADALDAAHERGLVHRDVKPANVLIEGPLGAERAYLTDFGIGKHAAGGGEGSEPGLTASGTIIGTADYVAPEQIDGGALDARADVYSLACVAFHALTGELPFRRETPLATLMAHAKAPRPIASAAAPGLPQALDGVLVRAMAIDPAARPASAGAFAAELERAARGEVSRAVGADKPTEPLPRVPSRSRIRAVAAAALLLAVGAAVVLLAGGGEGSGDGSAEPATAPKPRVADTAVGKGPIAIAVGELSVWVAARDGGQLDALERDAARQARPPVPVGRPTSVAVGFGSLWVLSEGLLYRLDPAEGTAPIPIGVGTEPADVAVDGSYVWVANGGSDDVSRVDPALNIEDGSVPVGTEPRSVATGGGAVWVANAGDGTVSRIDPASADTVGRPVPAGQRPTSIAFGEGSVWVTDNFNGELIRIDPERLEPVGEPVTTGAKPRGVAVGLGAVWVANGGDGTVSRYRSSDLAPLGEPIDVGADPADIAVDPGSGAVWTANFGDATASRIRP